MEAFAFAGYASPSRSDSALSKAMLSRGPGLRASPTNFAAIRVCTRVGDGVSAFTTCTSLGGTPVHERVRPASSDLRFPMVAVIPRLSMAKLATIQICASLLKNFVPFSRRPLLHFLHDVAIVFLQGVQLFANLRAGALAQETHATDGSIKHASGAFLFARLCAVGFWGSETTSSWQLLLSQHRSDYLPMFHGWGLLFFTMAGPAMVPLLVASVRAGATTKPSTLTPHNVGDWKMIVLSLTCALVLFSMGPTALVPLALASMFTRWAFEPATPGVEVWLLFSLSVMCALLLVLDMGVLVAGFAEAVQVAEVISDAYMYVTFGLGITVFVCGIWAATKLRTGLLLDGLLLLTAPGVTKITNCV